MKYISITIFTLLLFLGCTNKQKDLRDYYFPMEELIDGKVYLYKDVGEGLFGKEFWFIQSELINDHYELNITIMNSKALPTQYIKERSTLGEMKTVKTTLVERDPYLDEHPVDADIKQPYVFNFAMSDTTKSLYSILDWINPIDSLQYTLEKIRYYKGFSEREIMGENISILDMGINTTFKSFTPTDGETESIWPGDEKYGKGLGLVYYKRAVDPSITKEMQLIKIYGREEFNRLKHTDF